jgi:hypothetical protein
MGEISPPWYMDFGKFQQGGEAVSGITLNFH